MDDPKDIPLSEILQRLHERYRMTLRAPVGAEPKEIRSLSIHLASAAKARLRDYRISAPGAYVVPPRERVVEEMLRIGTELSDWDVKVLATALEAFLAHQQRPLITNLLHARMEADSVVGPELQPLSR